MIDGLEELAHEFPDTMWDAAVRLTRSLEPMVRIAMASRGVPHVYNSLNPYLAFKLAGWLDEDDNPVVVDTMRDCMKNLYESASA